MSEWIGLLGCSGCWGTREMGVRGTALGWPRRRRGGGRADGRGGVAKGGKLQHAERRVAWSLGATRGCHREQEVACGPPRRWAAPLSAGGREKQRSREVGDEVWTDLQFSKSSGSLL